MCDTILASPDATAERIMLFGKNSDRQRNEAQAVEYFPAADHAPDSRLTCNYISIPQVRHTHAVLLSRPFWIWGAEMGANEHGVVIGNEGLQARSPAPEEKALIGMDLLRLGLERATTAAEAVEVITRLLEHYGQGGNCGHLSPNFYNNSFLIADGTDAFVLETVGREWLTERVREVRTISNAYSIGNTAERTSAGLVKLIVESGWSDGAPKDYASVIADSERQHIGQSCERAARTASLLRAKAGQVRTIDLMNTLRDHHDPAMQPGGKWSPRTATRYSACLHAGGDRPRAQTTGAMVSEIRPKDSVHWVTATAAPCISIFKPVLMDVALPSHGPRPSDRFDPTALWWRHERLHRAALMGDLPKFLDDIRPERDALEADFRSRVTAVLKGGSTAERSRVIAECWREALEAEDRWYAKVREGARADETPYGAAWLEMNRVAGMV
jgi:secernin